MTTDPSIRRLVENFEHLARSREVFPVRRDLAALRKRWEAGDRNVVATVDEDGNPTDFGLEFTQEQRDDLVKGYKLARKGAPFDLDHQARVFVSILEGYGDGVDQWQAIKTPDQKTRVRTIRSFINAVEKFDAALAGMDSAALGWLYAVVTDRLAAEGVQVTDDRDVVSMRGHSIRAPVEAGELRAKLRRIAAAIVEAGDEACATLPKHEFVENDIRLKVSLWLERQVLEHDLEFDTSETGYPAQCLRAVLELGGIDVERVDYWLKKAAEHPDSHGRFLRSLRG